MRVLPDRLSPRLPGRVWAVLVWCALAGVAFDLAALVHDYRVWEEDAAEAGRIMHVTLGQHLWGWLPTSLFVPMLAVVGFALAWRERKVLFAAPAIALAAVPVFVDLYHGATGLIRPGLSGHLGMVARDLGEWVLWAEAAFKLALVLLPGLLVARQVKATRNPLHALAIGLMAVAAWIVGYYGVVYLAGNGQLNEWVGATYVAAFFFGAGMGFDRPAWPWLIVALPILPYSPVTPLFSVLHGAENLVLSGIALLGMTTVPLSRVFQRAWSTDPVDRSTPWLASTELRS